MMKRVLIVVFSSLFLTVLFFESLFAFTINGIGNFEWGKTRKYYERRGIDMQKVGTLIFEGKVYGEGYPECYFIRSRSNWGDVFFKDLIDNWDSLIWKFKNDVSFVGVEGKFYGMGKAKRLLNMFIERYGKAKNIDTGYPNIQRYQWKATGELGAATVAVVVNLRIVVRIVAKHDPVVTIFKILVEE